MFRLELPDELSVSQRFVEMDQKETEQELREEAGNETELAYTPDEETESPYFLLMAAIFTMLFSGSAYDKIYSSGIFSSAARFISLRF